MAPITLNKGHLVNKAGIEVDVIPIRRTPSPSPLFGTEMRRTRSEMGYRIDEQLEDDRRSLPDVVQSRKYKKGDVMNTIMRRNPSSFLIGCSDEEMSNNSGASSILSISICSSLMESVESIPERPITSAIMRWMSKSSFSSIDDIDREGSLDSSIVFETGSRNELAIPGIHVSRCDEKAPELQRKLCKRGLLQNGHLGKFVGES